ncbi:MAG: hypothetical protein ACYC9I_12650, partial [Desulfuromonadales bacterium]
MDFDFQHPRQIVPDPPPRSWRKLWFASAAIALGVLLLLSGPDLYRMMNPPPPPPPVVPEIRQKEVESAILPGETL